MKMTGKSIFKSFASLALAVVMMFTVIGVMPENVSAAEYSIAGNGTQTVTISDEQCYEFTGEEAYIKFIPKATGYVTVKATNVSALYNDTYGGITLCSASKQIISETDEKYLTQYNESEYYTMTYGVKKGTTYYLRVKAMGGTQITATFKSVKKNAATKKAKAKTIGKGKTVKGVIIAGDKKADWYKIKLTKSQKIKLSYSAKTCGTSNYAGIKVTFCKSNGKNFLYNSFDNVSRTKPSSWIQFYRKYTNGKTTGLATGTYYVKVEPSSTTSSGYYTLKWK